MAFTLAHFGQHQIATGANVVTVTIPAGAAVGILTIMTGGFGLGYFQGSVVDSGGNTYVAAGGANTGSTTDYTDAFYCLNTGASSTTITYTPSASYGTLFLVFSAVWVWTVSGGTATFGSQANHFQSAAGTGTDAVTTGSITAATGSVIMGWNTNQLGTTQMTVGTGFSSDFNSFGACAEHGTFNASQAATWTDATGTENVVQQGISFGLNTAAAPVPARGPMPRQLYVMP